MQQPTIDHQLYAMLLKHTRVLDQTMPPCEAQKTSVDLLNQVQASVPGSEAAADAVATVRAFCTNFSGATGNATIDEYLARLLSRGEVFRSCVDVAAILMSRLRMVLCSAIASALDMPLAGLHERFVVPTPLVFRSALAALVVAIKLQSDHLFTMNYYAAAGAVAPLQMRRLEMAFLQINAFDVSISADTYDRFLLGIARSNDHGLVNACEPFLSGFDATASQCAWKRCSLDDATDEDAFISGTTSSVQTPTSQQGSQ